MVSEIKGNAKISHTPGPWEVAHCGYDVCTQLGAINTFGEESPEDEGWTIASCAFGKLPNAECKANARLIAAAPDLLAALEEIVMLARIGQWYNEDLARDKIAAAKAAIAKANGEGE